MNFSFLVAVVVFAEQPVKKLWTELNNNANGTSNNHHSVAASTSVVANGPASGFENIFTKKLYN
jgi:hypothetical protein